MAKFRTGGDSIAAAATRSTGGKFTPRFKFEANKTKYIQFLSALDDTPTVLLHDFVITGEREDGGPVYNTFISRRDPVLDGSDGYDELMDRFGEKPTNKTIGLAVELEPIYEKKTGTKRQTLVGFDIATRQFENKDGETVEVPAVGLVVQSPFNFWNALVVNDDIKPIEETVFAVTRTGEKTSTNYTFVPVGDALDGIEEDLEEFFEEFDFEALLDDWADEDRMREIIAPLPDDFVVNPYNKERNKKSGKASGGSKSTRSRRAVVEPEEDDGDGDEPAEETKPARRRRNFDNLKADVAKKAAPAEDDE
jgi:hypothetical protein